MRLTVIASPPAFVATCRAVERLYILLESYARHNGDRLGEVGGRIVAEVRHGVIAADPESYLGLEPGWSPTLPARGGTFGLADMLIP